MDLHYYEIPPGIQLLHCLEFDQSITGILFLWGLLQEKGIINSALYSYILTVLGTDPTWTSVKHLGYMALIGISLLTTAAVYLRLVKSERDL